MELAQCPLPIILVSEVTHETQLSRDRRPRSPAESNQRHYETQFNSYNGVTGVLCATGTSLLIIQVKKKQEAPRWFTGLGMLIAGSC